MNNKTSNIYEQQYQEMVNQANKSNTIDVQAIGINKIKRLANGSPLKKEKSKEIFANYLENDDD